MNLQGCSEKSPDESKDGLELYFHRQNGCLPLTLEGIWFSTKALPMQDWGAPQPVQDPNGFIIPGGQPCISSDKMTLYYSDNPSGQFDIYYATRDAPPPFNSWTLRGLVLSDPNNPSNNLVNTPADEMGPSISDDGTLLYFDRMNVATSTTEIRCAWGGQAAGPNIVPPPYFPIVQLENRLTLPGMISASPDVSADYNFIVFERKMIGETDDGV